MDLNGTFLGNDFEIQNLYINDTKAKDNLGLFGIIENNAVIKDVNIASGKIVSNGSNTGAIAGSNAGKIVECSTNISVLGNTCVGGICGNLLKDGSIEKCVTNKVTISGSMATGGICGWFHVENLAIGAIKETVSFATVDGNRFVGGILGAIGAGKVNLEKCANYGNISGIESVGGITGIIQTNGTLSKCVNHGKILGKNSANTSSIGGISGGGGVFNPTLKTISDCYNTGDVSGNKSVGGLLR